jgi:hypothetical protein
MSDARDSTRADHLMYELSQANQKIRLLEEALHKSKEYPSPYLDVGRAMLAALKAWEEWYSVDSTEEKRDRAQFLGEQVIARAERLLVGRLPK